MTAIAQGSEGVMTTFIMKIRTFCFALIFVLNGAGAVAAMSEQAQRHFVRGTAAVELAASRNDLEVAAREFSEAIRLAPDWPEAHYNLGLVREKLDDLDEAISSLNRYLELAPGASDAAQVREMIYRLEYLRERNDVRGIWKTDESASQVSCSPEGYLVTGGTTLGSAAVVYDLQLEITNGPDDNRGRILSSKFRYGAFLKDAPFASARREGESIMIDKAVMYTCAADVRQDLCPWEARLTLRQVAENILEGEFYAGGFGRKMDFRTGRKQDDYFQCTGRIVLKRAGR